MALQIKSDNILAGDNDSKGMVVEMESPKKSESNANTSDEKIIEDMPVNEEETKETEQVENELLEPKTGMTGKPEGADSVDEETTKESPAKKEEKQNSTPTKESPVKESPKKKDTKKKVEQEAADATEQEEEQEDEEHEKKKGLFDLPLEVEGKRERHKVERISIGTPTVKKTPTEMKMGNGVPLGEIAYIEDQLRKHSADDLQYIHRLIYGHVGKASVLRRDIRKFTGFAFEENSPEFKQKVAFLQKLTMDKLRMIKNVLGVHSGGGTKDAMVTTIMVFIMKPVDHERKVPGKKRKSTAKTPKSTKKAKTSKTSDEVVDDEDDEEDEVETKEEEEKKKKGAEKEKKTPKTPKTPSTAKAPRKKKEPTKDASKESDADTEAVKKTSRKPSKIASDDDTSSNTSEEAAQENNPSEKELETVIEELLATFDLAQVSMKQMCQAVIERFPGTNISTRIDFLKSKIKQCLATK
ncbi:unnamed protein product [Cylicocyclus nassatus]|uniref:DEK-C domain-containing protein n=1 Tax=Cylicocyclus nassatus TaxID=53992 RepID=A0AA36M2T2_CYLNA|nr:unnamed protein product [Cylicocyclus nassatus]